MTAGLGAHGQPVNALLVIDPGGNLVQIDQSARLKPGWRYATGAEIAAKQASAVARLVGSEIEILREENASLTARIERAQLRRQNAELATEAAELEREDRVAEPAEPTASDVAEIEREEPASDAS